MILMVCSSVFQLYVAIIIKKVFLSDKIVDLVLTDATPRFSETKDNEYLKNFFNDVKYVEIMKNTKKLKRLQISKYGNMFYEVFPKAYAKAVWEVDVNKYDELYFSSYFYMNVKLFSAMKKGRKNVKVHLFEDGISTYLLNNKIKPYMPKILRRLFGIVPYEAYVDDVYVFEQDLVCLSEYTNMITIPKPKDVEGINEIFNDIFDNPDYEIKEKFVFFEESFNNDGYVTNDAELINELWECCGKESFILKHHPRNRKDRFKEVLPTMTVPIFWENYLLNHSIENNVLVTVSSNTVFVPHIIAGCTPRVIMLYKIFNGTSPLLGSGNFENYVERYKSLYKDYTDAKFYFPETIEEYRELIKQLKEED